jgi:hypothetical protein
MKPGTFKLNAPWNVVKERMKENDIHLTDEDLEYQEGREDELLERLERKMNRSRQQIKDYIESISSNTEKAG